MQMTFNSNFPSQTCSLCVSNCLPKCISLSSLNLSKITFPVVLKNISWQCQRDIRKWLYIVTRYINYETLILPIFKCIRLSMMKRVVSVSDWVGYVLELLICSRMMEHWQKDIYELPIIRMYYFYFSFLHLQQICILLLEKETSMAHGASRNCQSFPQTKEVERKCTHCAFKDLERRNQESARWFFSFFLTLVMWSSHGVACTAINFCGLILWFLSEKWLNP